MTALILTRGLPASGKSTWAKAFVAERPGERVRVNRDNIRWSQGIRTGIGTYEEENLVSLIEESVVRAALKAGKDVVIDAMHLKASYAKRWARIHPVQIKEFPTDLATLIVRDMKRGIDGHRSVGESVILDLAKRFHIPEDGTLSKLRLDDVQPDDGYFKPYVRGPVLAYSFDIDGTLAQMQGRSPYDTSRYDEDVADRHLSEMLWHLQDGARANVMNEPEVAFLALSGRSEEFKDVTLEWLGGWGLHIDDIFMRPEGDTRNDAVVKSELVDKHISGVYDVIAHFDDRDRVVNALRAKGMKVLQVQPGNF